ncbi:MAG TPA: hypothetical protein VG297_14035 [Bryobacteraceae bacterium]|nr:hypothetical protein [Bryobacteraceae bacterium]
MSTPALFPHEFRTTKPPRPLYCHQEFLDKLELRRNEPAGKRAALLMQQMAVDISRLHYKGASGANRGWRRSRLGGGSGSHFYAWWAPAGAGPLKRSPGFEDQSDAVFLRDIRHHDDHAPVSPGNPASDYLPINVPDLRSGEYTPAPWTQQQARFARSRAIARVLKGHPGSGKTTALLHAADESQAERVLYLTFSRDLAALARDYFDRFCSDSRTFVVQTFPDWLRQVAGWREGELDAAEARARFRRDLANQHRALGPWSNNPEALYDEMHAHLVGAAVPEKSGRFPAAEHLRLPDDAYRAQRSRYLGQAAEAVLEAARRLDRMDAAPLADRYFPDLALAWRAARALRSEAKPAQVPAYGCIAVDEIQDLTPLEVYTVIAMAHLTNSRNRQAALLLAGDEAQTVRATDFEWAWLNDMLHDSMGAPQEFKLPVNLRSPRRIADLVNRAWDLYDYLHKQDRPSGTGYADIDDDSPDEVLYGAIRGEELPELLTEFPAREGMAVIAFDQAGIPKEALGSVLSPAEAKGLDFHSVCLLNGGALLRRIADRASGPASSLGTRLAIDQLRVALSRPTGQLIWIDVAPDAGTIREVGEFLRPRGEAALAPMTLEALRASFEEEELDVEERIQRCRKDARQFVDVKPDLAWSRAQQAVAMLGAPGDAMAVTEPATRAEAYLTLAEVCFKLAIRGRKLSAELGRPDLYGHAADAARGALKFGLAGAIRATGAAERSSGTDRLNTVASTIQTVTSASEELPSWLIVEIAPRADAWLAELDRHIEAGDNAVTANFILPPFFDVMGMPDAGARKERLAQRAVKILMKGRKYVQALGVLDRLPQTAANLKLAAECCEESGQFEKAAAKYAELGDKEKALRCFRSAADFDAALGLVRQMEGHPARESLEWLAELNTMLARRPENFNRVMTPPEKKLLESMLERGLGVQRKKPAPRKATAKKTETAKTEAKKPAPRKRARAAEPPAGPRKPEFF